MIFVDVQEKQTRTARTSLWDYWLIHSLRKARFASPAPSMYVSVRVRRLVLFLSFFFFHDSLVAVPAARPDQARLWLHINIKSRSREEASKECETNKTNDVCSHVFCLSSVQKNGGEGREHIISLSSANKADHQQKVSHTCRWWQRHITPTEDRNTFRLGARREGESLNCGYLASLRDWTCCASVWYCFPSTARWNQSVW